MFTTYPEWGPASHSPENPNSYENTASAVQAALDLRDADDLRPDDN